MSRKKISKALKGKPGYNVGYAKPPEGTRFKPGESGNPRGRPKGSKNKRSHAHQERLREIVMDEAYRGIAVRDGDRTVTLPMAQAIIRSIAVNAAKGQHRSQRLFTELLANTEETNRAFDERWLETAIEYKIQAEKELLRRKRLGITDLPEPLPHPDHIEIDFVEGTVRVIGPCTKEEKAEFDEIVANRHLLIDELRDIGLAREAATDPKERRRLDRIWNEKMEFVGLINRLAPRRDER